LTLGLSFAAVPENTLLVKKCLHRMDASQHVPAIKFLQIRTIMKFRMKKLILSSIAIGSLFLNAANAAPADNVYTPQVEYGKRELDYRYGWISKGNDPHRNATLLGLGYGAGQYWYTELYLRYNREGDSGNRFNAIGWENKYQLTEVGQYPVDIGFLVKFELPDSRSQGLGLKFGPLFQTDFGNTQVNANLLFSRNYHADVPNPMRLDYQWQAKYRSNPLLEFGVQGFGEVGAWDHWAPRSQQTHLVGPAFFGKLPLAGRQAIKYSAAYLIDVSDAIHSKAFRAQVEYEY
jgi:hypothetical protein